jgi:hypothetical protein
MKSLFIYIICLLLLLLNLSFAKDYDIVDSQLRLENYLDQKFNKLSESLLQDIQFDLSTQVKLSELKPSDSKPQNFKPSSIALLPNPQLLKDKFENANISGFNISSITVNLQVNSKVNLPENLKKELTSKFIAHVGMPVSLVVITGLDNAGIAEIKNVNSLSSINNSGGDALKKSKIPKRSMVEDFIVNYQALIGCLFLTIIYLSVQVFFIKKESMQENYQQQNISQDANEIANKLANLTSQKMTELSTSSPVAEELSRFSEALQKITTIEDVHKNINKDLNNGSVSQNLDLTKLEDTLSLLANLIEKSSLVGEMTREVSKNQYFSYLKSIPSQALMSELTILDGKDVASILSFFEVQKIKECFAFASAELKKEILGCAVSGKLLSGKEINGLDSKLKNIPSFANLSNTAQAEERSLAALNLFIEALSPKEEIEFIESYKSSTTESNFKDHIFTLGMLPDWSKEHLSSFAKTLSLSEIKSIIFIFPNLKELFLENMGRFDKQVLLLELDKPQNEIKYELESLQKVRAQMKEYIEQNNINLKQIYQ